MKHLLIALVSLCAISTAFAEAPKSVLTKSEQKDVLQTIDDMCGDVWCEGDYGYEFNDFDCSAAVDGTTCTMKFVMIKTDYVKEKRSLSISMERRFPVTCEFGPYKTKKEILGDESDLAETFWDTLNDCIGEMEQYLEKK